MINKILKILNNIMNFFLCLLKVNCKYSIKKFFSFIFIIIIIYCMLFNKFELIPNFLIFLGGLLAIRSLDKLSFSKNTTSTQNDYKEKPDTLLVDDEKEPENY